MEPKARAEIDSAHDTKKIRSLLNNQILAGDVLSVRKLRRSSETYIVTFKPNIHASTKLAVSTALNDAGYAVEFKDEFNRQARFRRSKSPQARPPYPDWSTQVTYAPCAIVYVTNKPSRPIVFPNPNGKKRKEDERKEHSIPPKRHRRREYIILLLKSKNRK